VSFMVEADRYSRWVGELVVVRSNFPPGRKCVWAFCRQSSKGSRSAGHAMANSRGTRVTFGELSDSSALAPGRWLQASANSIKAERRRSAVHMAFWHATSAVYAGAVSSARALMQMVAAIRRLVSCFECRCCVRFAAQETRCSFDGQRENCFRCNWKLISCPTGLAPFTNIIQGFG
jgi:hypothetical protein